MNRFTFALRHGAFVLFAAMTVQAQAADPIRIGVAVGLSGANSVVAPAVVQSSQLAVDEINAAGGILGRKLELDIVDDASGAVGAQKAFDTLVFQKKVNAVIAMETSAARNAALPVISRGKLPYIYTSFYEGRSCNKWMYVNGWVPEQQVAPVVDYFTKSKHAKTFFLVGSDYAFGRGMLEFTKKYIEQQGGKVIGEEYLPIDGSDWTTVVSKIRSSKPDALISATAGGAPNVSLAKQLKGAGLTLPYGNLAVDEGTAQTMGDAADGLYMSASYLTGINTPENKKFMEALKKKFGADMKTPNELSEPQYEAFYLFKAAVEKAGSTDSDKVIKALGEVSFNGPRGMVAMNKSRHTPLSMRLGQVQHDGTIKILETFTSVDPGNQCPSIK
ncbi:amino acid ABC transporter [Herbaspirillum rubrisubalbicans]|uniref:Amino acid ABC transporter n=3 Tax=Herbaspirillum rubrisubalbicans TaxID=80842 RepID=A0ABX9C117_9BURK|nr:branched-chain amino acid transport system substrate-binding protein [Herbaspirillum rubrisubalbicans]NQE49812.1 amino acid ABC transporter [Herbaspirillum rubrisubalbicans]QJQ03639.1 amino acid ABC transporter [Herbaspirillum rubrisubalbicans Os34]RAM63835.1 amino acid ABC transporter [Herbaspirillum rubrisubalbicans]RAN44702.1 amino acid ABC transporter [Herbaspirillum rubrisubalbicans]